MERTRMRNSRPGSGSGLLRTSWLSASGLRVLAALLLSCGSAQADLQAAKDEPNLEKRSDRALDNMKQALEAAREAAKKNDDATIKTAVQEVVDSAELSFQSLHDSGKAARANPKHFK